MRHFFLSIVFLLSLFHSNACLNIYHTFDKEGNVYETENYKTFFRPFDKNFDLKKLSKKLSKLETKLKKEGDYQILSDYAVILLKIGETKTALDLLSELMINYPDEYQIAANLGTAYELNGEVDSALKYIQRGIELNPEAHAGSEWIHVEILKTKQKLLLDSMYLQKHSVLNLSENDEKDSSILVHLSIQLHERVPFSPGPNAIMASLIEDFGDCYANNVSFEYAKTFYTMAKDYYGNDSKRLEKKIENMDSLSNAYDGIYKDIHRTVDERHGMHFPITNVTVKSILKNQNSSNYEIDTSALNLNVDTLLSYVGLTKTIIVPEVDSTELSEPENETSVTAESEISTDQSDMNFVIYLVLGILIIVGGIFFWLRR